MRVDQYVQPVGVLGGAFHIAAAVTGADTGACVVSLVSGWDAAHGGFISPGSVREKGVLVSSDTRLR